MPRTPSSGSSSRVSYLEERIYSPGTRIRNAYILVWTGDMYEGAHALYNTRDLQPITKDDNTGCGHAQVPCEYHNSGKMQGNHTRSVSIEAGYDLSY